MEFESIYGEDEEWPELSEEREGTWYMKASWGDKHWVF